MDPADLRKMATLMAQYRDTPMDLWTDSRIDWIQIHAYGKDVSNLMFERISPFDPAMPRITYTEKPTIALVQPILDAAAAYGQLQASFPAAELFAPGVLK